MIYVGIEKMSSGPHTPSWSRSEDQAGQDDRNSCREWIILQETNNATPRVLALFGDKRSRQGDADFI